LVREDKVCAWLQDEVLKRIIPPKRARGYRSKLSKSCTVPVGAIDGVLGSADAAQPSSEEERSENSEEEKEGAGQSLTYATVKGYTNAIAELHRWQVSDGTNPWPTFRGPALKGLMIGLQRGQVQKDRESFTDRAAGGINAGYSSEELLRMSQQLLLGATAKIQVSMPPLTLYTYTTNLYIYNL
jgi:hypothetical protein